MALSAHELVLRYAAAACDAREMLLNCSRQEKHGGKTCYKEWCQTRGDSDARFPSWREVQTFCPECRANEEIIHRKRKAAQERGRMLVLMQMYARRCEQKEAEGEE